jgi:hypothetical protein
MRVQSKFSWRPKHPPLLTMLSCCGQPLPLVLTTLYPWIYQTSLYINICLPSTPPGCHIWRVNMRNIEEYLLIWQPIRTRSWETQYAMNRSSTNPIPRSPRLGSLPQPPSQNNLSSPCIHGCESCALRTSGINVTADECSYRRRSGTSPLMSGNRQMNA